MVGDGPEGNNGQAAGTCDEDKAETEGDVVARAVEQRSYRLKELLESEAMYVGDLEQCVTYITYMRESKEEEEPDIKMPEDLREGKDRMIFGNLEMIYEWHRE